MRKAGDRLTRSSLIDEVAYGVTDPRARLRGYLRDLSHLPAPLGAMIKVEDELIGFDLLGQETDVDELRDSVEHMKQGGPTVPDSEILHAQELLRDIGDGVFLPGFEDMEKRVTKGRGIAGQVVAEVRAQVLTLRADLAVATANVFLDRGRPADAAAVLDPIVAGSEDRDDVVRTLIYCPARERPAQSRCGDSPTLHRRSGELEMRILNSQLHRLRNHLGRGEDMIAAIALAVLAVGSLSFTLITHTGTPAGAALAYMAAVDRADTEYVWSHSIVNALNGSAPNATFLDRAALDAQLKATAHSRSAIGVQSVNYMSEGTRVVVTYNTSSGPAKTSLIMRGGAPHSWPILVHPAGLDIALPTGAGALAIDGRIVETNGNELKIWVLPGIHTITLGASEI